ncbi:MULTISPECIES: hypothetical protein [Bradyrhizobium]|uniref:Uncharacterized protein n=3 Tax=Bradyrhizobium TaxID=374 RepID=A0AAE6CCA5_9BRAD|nr:MULTISPECIES: hypothetical protein [Bradyrhizobium]MCG2632878.1 hypothetical protein [Bradyrhizobium zhengyangense]MCG2645491.1 hypothetical protein [Bradyrhizobium zhengyangense]MCG2673050.1 hypothetical protein [Bradyrhizobium zhengyangense]MDN4984423.1 hypothetical protein [Bradyrhizobium sp. WYCCWR 13022]MDN5002416.1 hypothetical protein [Bradyrhizobium sp. WYCCWR 12677]
MTRLSEHSLEPGASFEELKVDDNPPAITPATARATESAIERTHANGGKSFAIFQDDPPQDLPVVSAIVTALDLTSIDPVSRVNVNEARGEIGEIKPGSELAWLNGPSLADNLLSFVTPRLFHSHVLRPEKQGILLERLADTLSAAPESSVSREDLAIVQLELRRLILLRQNDNGLIKG